jgi:hypothetical protein
VAAFLVRAAELFPATRSSTLHKSPVGAVIDGCVANGRTRTLGAEVPIHPAEKLVGVIGAWGAAPIDDRLPLPVRRRPGFVGRALASGRAALEPILRVRLAALERETGTLQYNLERVVRTGFDLKERPWR